MQLIKIREEDMEFYVTEDTLKHLSSDNVVFYNPLMKINRDFTVAFLKTISKTKELKILDGMAGSGIRSLRILKEVDNIKELWINDISENAIKIIKKNLELNHNLLNKTKVLITKKDFNLLCLEEKDFDYIDLDPFGTPVPFIQSGILGLKNKGYIGITATDTSALTGSKPSALLRKYCVYGIKTDFFREFGIRVLAKKVIEIGAQFECALIPKFSYYYKHHYRIFFQKIRGKGKVKKLLKNVKFILYCNKCLYREILEELKDKCSMCKNKLQLLGPIYVGPLWDSDILNSMEKYIKWGPARKIFELIKEERKYKCPWYYNLRFFSKVYKISKLKPMEEYAKALGCRTHFDPLGIRSDLKFQEIIKSLLT